MREILFRGKTYEGEWKEGGLISSLNGKRFYIGNMYQVEEVDPETVGQYTGLTDNNGKKIFEGDIISCHSFTGINDFKKSLVGWCDILLCFRADKHSLYGDFQQDYEIIGNIHDNPELLKEGADLSLIHI